MRQFATLLSILAIVSPLAGAAPTGGKLPGELAEAVELLTSIEPTGKVSPTYRQAWEKVAKASADDLPHLLRAGVADNPIAENWLTSAADALASDTLERGESLPIDALEELVQDLHASSRGRRVAFEWIRKAEPDRAERMLDSLRDDPNFDLRYDAVAKLLTEITNMPNDAPGREALVREALKSARDLKQIKQCQRELTVHGESLQLVRHLGFVTTWRLIGPFDNSGSKGFGAVYPPEEEIDFDAGYLGKMGPVAWRDELLTTEDDMGKIDIADAIGPLKGAVVYLFAEVECAQAQLAQVRYASPNATKLWVNGQLVSEHEVYHTENQFGQAPDPSSQFDQYSHPVEFKQGSNTLLLKVCQNEQTESWAQDWQFSLRVTDALGGAIPLVNKLASDLPPE